jgi:hypothetical protein
MVQVQSAVEEPTVPGSETQVPLTSESSRPTREQIELYRELLNLQEPDPAFIDPDPELEIIHGEEGEEEIKSIERSKNMGHKISTAMTHALFDLVYTHGRTAE